MHTIYYALLRDDSSRDVETLLDLHFTCRFATRLAADHKAVLQPDVETPFEDAQDVVNRLLPYHIFLQPKDDLRPLIDPCPSTLHSRKGKRKATEDDLLREEIAGTNSDAIKR